MKVINIDDYENVLEFYEQLLFLLKEKNSVLVINDIFAAKTALKEGNFIPWENIKKELDL